jgi:ribonuclease PH
MARRTHDQLRPFAITPHYLSHPEGSVLIEAGDTRVICTATVEDRVPPWLVGKGKGWVTAEYDMLPRATNTRNQRDSHRGRINGRTQEIGRLIGRSLRGVVDMTAFGERSITVDCDVIQADGGTRTAAITGGFVALALAMRHLESQKKAKPSAIRDHVAAISAGIIEGEPYIDLDYSMDSNAHVDMNIVMTGDGHLVEVLGTGEGGQFTRKELDGLLDLAFGSLPQLIDLQKRAIEAPLGENITPVRL